MREYNTIKDRLKLLKELKGELHLAIEDRFTNLRIFIDEIYVYMRLDKFQAYSAPLSEETIGYLNKPNDIINQLLQYGFKSSITSLNDILEITKKLKYRRCKEW